MPMISVDITSKMKEMTNELIKSGYYTSQSEAIRDAIRELYFNIQEKNKKTITLEEARNIAGKITKKTGKTLSQAVIESRDE